MKIHFITLLACALALPLFADPAPTTAAPPESLAMSQVAKTGNGEWVYQSVPHWGQLPEGESWKPTHGSIVIDKAGNIYASTNSPSGIVVFKPDGTFLKSMKEFGVVHGMVIREEHVAGERKEFIYAARVEAGVVVKIDVHTETCVMTIPAPKEEYKDGGWACTGVAVAPDGSIFVTDGYGNSRIHKFDAKGKYLLSFAGQGAEDGKCETCHTCSIDMRSGTPMLLVCDRENRRLTYFDLDGKFIRHTTLHLRRPCAVSYSPDNKHIAVAELEGRVTILDENNVPVAFLGDNPKQADWANYKVPPAEWKPAIFTAPHSVCFDKDNNLFVMDWSSSGRITRLELAN